MRLRWTLTDVRSAMSLQVSVSSTFGIRLRQRFGLSAAIGMAAVTLVVAAPSVLAASLSIELGQSASSPPICDAFDGCLGTVTGALTGSNEGTYQLQLALHAPLDVSDNQICFAPVVTGTNQAILSFAPYNASGQLVLGTGSLCLPADVSLETGEFSIPFTVQSGTGIYEGATGRGVLMGQFAGSILGGSSLTFMNISSSNLSLPVPSPCADLECVPGPDPISPGATPELDSLILFGSGIVGIGTYLRRRYTASRPVASALGKGTS
jgi:hypothetical protein